ncbi:MAG: ComEC/Rec2-related protein:DNA internalization-related competence protein ComEC/Rec2 [Rhodocyclaceae bacterium]|nr:ComEC/Rec2-related protein:DNA internalization-related competence protein ComEC/Rec2 [Rhodocyclaceae bacterium]
MRRLIVAVAIGIICLQFQPQLPAWGAWAMVAGGLVLPAWRWRRKRFLQWLAVAACIAFGFGWAAWRAELRLADSLALEWEGRDVEVVGVVAALPQPFHQGSRFEFEVESVLTGGARLPSRVMLSWYEGRRDGEDQGALMVRPGERWRLTVRLKRPHGNANPHGFDYEAWLLERNIRATGYVRPKGQGQRLADMVWRPGYGVERARDAVRQSFRNLLPAEDYPYAGILVALAVGDQGAIQGDLWNVFNRTGITHLVSVSGLHITLVAAVLAIGFGWLWRRVPFLALRQPAQRAAILVGWLAAFAYTWLAGFGVPAQRTLYMLTVAALAMVSGRRVAPSRILCLALAVVLLIDPWAVLAAGFWLSFGAVGALLWVGAGLVGQARGWRGRLSTWGGTQWAATLASLPVLLLVFQQFSLVSPLANAVAIPVVSFMVTPLALLAAAVPWWPILALAHGILAGLMVFLEWCAGWPVWVAPAPPLWAAVGAGVGVAILLLPRGLAGRWVGAVLLLPAAFWPATRPDAGEARVTVLDVGQGLAALVQTRDHALLYDPGPLYSAESDAGQRVVVPYLRAIGLNSLDVMMVTHRDSDHSGGMASVAAALPVGMVRTSVAELGGKPCLAGQSWEWDGVRFSLLHPQTADYETGGKTNHLSCVLKVEAGGTGMLLTSDIEAKDEAALLARDAAALQSDVMLVPHHGSRTSSTPPFIAAVGARAAIVPVGYRNRFGHPKPDVMERYESLPVPVWRTDRDGALIVRLGVGGSRIEAWRQEHRRYWHGQ